MVTFLFFAAGTVLWAPVLAWSGTLPVAIVGWASVASLIYAGAFVLYIGALSRSYAILETALVAAWIGALVLVAGEWEDTVALARERPGKALLAGGLNMGSYALLLVAFTGLDASIAEPASALSMLVTVVLAGVFFHEPWRQRLPGAAVMCVGAWLLFQ